jgi:hypothetical protein
LELPKTLKIHPVFHASLLHKKPQDDFEQDPKPLPPVVMPEGEEEYKVERIVDYRKEGRQHTVCIK